MPKTKEQKKQIINELLEKLSRQKMVVFTNFRGLSVNKIQELRKNLKTQSIDFKVVKKTLARRAFLQRKIGINPRDVEGELALVFGYTDRIIPAKILYKFSKENPDFKILGGISENKFFDSEMIIALAKLPSREQLLANLLAGLNAPLSGFVNILQGNLRNLVYLLNSIKTKRESA